MAGAYNVPLPFKIPRTTMTIRVTPAARRVWEPLSLADQTVQSATDRLNVLRVIRSVYEPMLVKWLESGQKWETLFNYRDTMDEFEANVFNRKDKLPANLKLNESKDMLGLKLFDVLIFYRNSDQDWQEPLKSPWF